LAAKIKVELDLLERNRLLKEAGLIMLNDVAVIPTYPASMRNYWWPWIKNYYGECNIHDYPCPYPFAFAWIDQVLKAEMGY